ncbi:MAG: HypC/HybG/HupF family hydrogenase formation chaperone [Spirochaetaceae bacterium]|nr:MAG: HypC/HybG/HupF family hydrogenase formation chaperone [Spirochaetaceae bacterium]
MCLGVPGKVVELTGETAKVSIGGVMYDAALAIAEDIEIGDYVLMHAGFVLEKISAAEADETLEVIREYTNLKVD